MEVIGIRPDKLSYYISNVVSNFDVCIMPNLYVIRYFIKDNIPGYKKYEHYYDGNKNQKVGCLGSNKEWVIINLTFNHIGYKLNRFGDVIKEHLDFHSNVIIINQKRREIERFEPHIDNFSIDNDKYLKDYVFRDLINSGYNYLSTLDYYTQGPQNIEEIVSKNLVEGGFCTWWSLYYLENRLSNPQISREELLDDLTDVSPEELFRLIYNYRMQIIKKLK